MGTHKKELAGYDSCVETSVGIQALKCQEFKVKYFFN